MNFSTPEASSVPPARSVLTTTVIPDGYSSYGPLTSEEAQIQTLSLDSFWSSLRDGHQFYPGVRHVPVLHPDLMSCLADLGEKNALRVVDHTRIQLEALFDKVEVRPHVRTARHAVLDMTFMDLKTRLQSLFSQRMHDVLRRGGVVEGYTLEPIRDIDDEEVSTPTTPTNVIPFGKVA